MIDIRDLSIEDRIQRLILQISLNNVNKSIHSPSTPGVLGGTPQSLNLWGSEIEMTEDELYDIFSVIAEKVHFIVTSPSFILDGYQTRVDTIAFHNGYKDAIEHIRKYIEEDLKTKILYFYSLSKHSESYPESFRYHLRVLAKDDIVLLRDKKINDILGE